MNNQTINWQLSQAPAELHSLLKTLGEEYPIVEGETSGIDTEFIKSVIKGTAKVIITKGQAVITYNRVENAARALGSLLAGIETDEQASFKTLGIMLDCSRNAVMKVEHLKKWLRRLALMGYNMAMLYTEDTYQLPGEPYFGYLRGPYTMEEMKEVDACATSLGIEMIACIQTLGHLEQIMQWAPFDAVRDTSSVLLVDKPQTYTLIDKMLAFWSEALNSRRIHIGMDETHDLGRGKFMDKYGYERGFEIFNRHLAKVNELCAKYNYPNPMIWSDMYFRMSNTTSNYYDEASTIPADVKEKIPANIELVYWDYYHKDAEFYSEWIKRHRYLGFKPSMGSGVWTWGRLWYDHRQTKATVDPCIEACRKEKVDELFFTLWGDDGAYCEFDSSLAGLAYCAELSYNTVADDKLIAARFAAVCHADYLACLKAGNMESQTVIDDKQPVSAPAMLWDDPLYAIVERSYGEQSNKIIANIKAEWTALKTELEALADNGCGNLEHAIIILNTLLAKISYRQQLMAAYSARDNDALDQIAVELTEQMIERVEILHYSLRQQWMSRNKPFGFEIIQARLDTLIGRYQEVAVRIKELLDGEIDSIPELDVEIAPQGYSYQHCHNKIGMPPISRF